MRIHELKCFGARAGDGNPALVIEGDHSAAQQRQAFARERNVTCVFIDDGAGPVLDYFYPHMRSPLCLHATLAAARVLFARQGTDAPIAVTTTLRGQRLDLSRDGEACFVRLERQDAPQVAGLPELAARLLGAPVSAARVASIGSPKLLVEVGDPATLDALRPDLPLIVEWGRANGVNGCYAYCQTGPREYEGRNFNHLDPALEDSATGVAAGALAVVLEHGLTLRQGKVTGRDCLIRVRVEGEAVLVGGRAETSA
jgi:PhzF family phenazine biosynthesis protein